MDTFLAIILICSPGAGLADITTKCMFIQDKFGPVSQRTTCAWRLDQLWERSVNDHEFLVRAKEKIGDFKTTSLMSQRGFCLDPWLPWDKEIQKYYEP